MLYFYFIADFDNFLRNQMPSVEITIFTLCFVSQAVTILSKFLLCEDITSFISIPMLRVIDLNLAR
jgi:hypothetical protein